MTVSRVPDPVTYIRQHPEMYIPSDERSLRDKLLLQLASDAIALNVSDLTVKKAGTWTLLGSDTDWLRLGKFQKDSPRDLFNFVVPLIEAGQNSIRHEVVVNALAKKVLLFGPEGCAYVSASEDEPETTVIELCLGLRKTRVVAFSVTERMDQVSR